jgi:thioredoxin reductase
MVPRPPAGACSWPRAWWTKIPDVPDMRELWGRNVFVCPCCDGWEVKQRPWGMFAPTAATLEFAPLLTGLTSDVVAFTYGNTDFGPSFSRN